MKGADIMQRYKKDFNTAWNYMEKWVHLTKESPADEWKECIEEGNALMKESDHPEFVMQMIHTIQVQIGRQ